MSGYKIEHELDFRVLFALGTGVSLPAMMLIKRPDGRWTIYGDGADGVYSHVRRQVSQPEPPRQKLSKKLRDRRLRRITNFGNGVSAVPPKVDMDEKRMLHGLRYNAGPAAFKKAYLAYCYGPNGAQESEKLFSFQGHQADAIRYYLEAGVLSQLDAMPPKSMRLVSRDAGRKNGEAWITEEDGELMFNVVQGGHVVSFREKGLMSIHYGSAMTLNFDYGEDQTYRIKMPSQKAAAMAFAKLIGGCRNKLRKNMHVITEKDVVRDPTASIRNARPTHKLVPIWGKVSFFRTLEFSGDSDLVRVDQSVWVIKYIVGVTSHSRYVSVRFSDGSKVQVSKTSIGRKVSDLEGFAQDMNRLLMERHAR